MHINYTKIAKIYQIEFGIQPSINQSIGALPKFNMCNCVKFQFDSIFQPHTNTHQFSFVQPVTIYPFVFFFQKKSFQTQNTYTVSTRINHIQWLVIFFCLFFTFCKKKLIEPCYTMYNVHAMEHAFDLGSKLDKNRQLFLLILFLRLTWYREKKRVQNL